tara:strand:- start:576 stop:1049 length:474 start_codon:yes stop_codon:yes gene_type:complete
MSSTSSLPFCSVEFSEPSSLEQLNEYINVSIGNHFKIDMWETATIEQQKYAHSGESRDTMYSDYYQFIISQFHNHTLLNIICYDPCCGLLSRGTKSLYTLNVNTGKPTRNSADKTIFSDELISKIKEFISLIPIGLHGRRWESKNRDKVKNFNKDLN